MSSRGQPPPTNARAGIESKKEIRPRKRYENSEKISLPEISSSQEHTSTQRSPNYRSYENSEIPGDINRTGRQYPRQTSDSIRDIAVDLEKVELEEHSISAISFEERRSDHESHASQSLKNVPREGSDERGKSLSERQLQQQVNDRESEMSRLAEAIRERDKTITKMTAQLNTALERHKIANESIAQLQNRNEELEDKLQHSRFEIMKLQTSATFERLLQSGAPYISDDEFRERFLNLSSDIKCFTITMCRNTQYMGREGLKKWQQLLEDPSSFLKFTHYLVSNPDFLQQYHEDKLISVLMRSKDASLSNSMSGSSHLRECRLFIRGWISLVICRFVFARSGIPITTASSQDNTTETLHMADVWLSTRTSAALGQFWQEIATQTSPDDSTAAVDAVSFHRWRSLTMNLLRLQSPGQPSIPSEKKPSFKKLCEEIVSGIHDLTPYMEKFDSDLCCSHLFSIFEEAIKLSVFVRMQRHLFRFRFPEVTNPELPGGSASPKANKKAVDPPRMKYDASWMELMPDYYEEDDDEPVNTSDIDIDIVVRPAVYRSKIEEGGQRYSKYQLIVPALVYSRPK